MTDADLAHLPAAARRYLEFMNVVGRPRDWSFRLAGGGRFRLAPNARWMPCKAWQYNSGLEIARVFVMNVRFAGLVPLIARDTYVRGRGRMSGKLLDLLPVVNATGPPLDIGELATWLNDAILVAPSMLLRPETTWHAVDDHAFEIELVDRGKCVRGRVSVDERGAPLTFETHDRFRDGTGRERGEWVRDRWTTPIEGWRRVAGRALYTSVRAVWGDDFAYAEFAPWPETLEFNIPPDGRRAS